MSETIILQALEAILRSMDTMRTYVQALASMVAVVIGMQALMLIWMSSARRSINELSSKIKTALEDIENIEETPP